MRLQRCSEVRPRTPSKVHKQGCTQGSASRSRWRGGGGGHSPACRPQRDPPHTHAHTHAHIRAHTHTRTHTRFQGRRTDAPSMSAGSSTHLPRPTFTNTACGRMAAMAAALIICGPAVFVCVCVCVCARMCACVCACVFRHCLEHVRPLCPTALRPACSCGSATPNTRPMGTPMV